MRKSPDDDSYLDASPVPDTSFLRSGLNVFDAIYNPRETALLREAAAFGCNTLNGLPMLLYQGAESFRIWTGREFPVDRVRAELFP
jgi:shikimate dehydrogenase